MCGSHIAVHERPDIGRLAALCCWEHLQPLTKYAMYAQKNRGDQPRDAGNVSNEPRCEDELRR